MTNAADLIATLRARWKLIVGVVALVTALTAAWLAMQPRLYTASASLLFNGIGIDPVIQDEDNRRQQSLATQADIIQSAALAELVVARLALARDPALRAQWEAATGGNARIEPWLARRLRASVEATPTKQSNVLAVRFTSDTPELAARIANGFAGSFIEKQLALRTEPARAVAGWIQQRGGALRQRLETAQARLTAFRQARGLTGADRIDIETNRLNELSAQLAAAQAQSTDAASRANVAGATAPEVLGSAVVQNLRSAIATKAGQLGQLQATLGPNHPNVRTANAELAQLRSELGAEIGKTAASLDSASGSARAREAGLRALVDQQRQKVLAMSGDQDQLAVLQRDVDLARQAYEGLTQRGSTARLESELQQTDVALLDSAVPPGSPSSPRVALGLFLAVVFGTMLGVTIALLLEFMEPRARTAASIERVTARPVLADLSRRPLLLARAS